MTLDLILLVLLALAAVSGWRSGAMAMFISVAVLVVASIAASLLGTKVGTLLHLGPHWIWPIVGFLFTFVIFLIAGAWAKRFIRPKQGFLRSLDGAAGAALGLLRAAIILGMILALLQLVHLPPEHITAGSMLYPLLLKCAGILIAALRPYIHTSAGAGDVEV